MFLKIEVFFFMKMIMRALFGKKKKRNNLRRNPNETKEGEVGSWITEREVTSLTYS